MPVLGVREIELELMGRKLTHDHHEHVTSRSVERPSRSRRGRHYSTSNSSYDPLPRSSSGHRRSGSVSSNVSMGSRRGSGANRNQKLPSLKSFRKHLRSQYNEKAMQVVMRYIEKMELSAEVTNNINYLRRCRDLGLIPEEYWMSNSRIKNTREVVRLLDECSFRLMCHDQDNYLRTSRNLSMELSRTENQLEKFLSAQDYQRLCAIVKVHHRELFARIRDEQKKAVEDLRQEVEDYQTYLQEKRRSSRGGSGGGNARGAGRGPSRSGSRRRYRNNRRRDETSGGDGDRVQTSKSAASNESQLNNSSSNNKSGDRETRERPNDDGSRDSDGDSVSQHRVSRRRARSNSLGDDNNDTNSDDEDQ